MEVEAIYEDGVFMPLKRLPIPNGTQVKVIIPDEIMRKIKDRIDFALSLLKRGEVSVGKAAEIAGLDYRSFLEEMRKHGVVFPYDVKELEEDLRDS